MRGFSAPPRLCANPTFLPFASRLRVNQLEGGATWRLIYAPALRRGRQARVTTRTLQEIPAPSTACKQALRICFAGMTVMALAQRKAPVRCAAGAIRRINFVVFAF